MTCLGLPAPRYSPMSCCASKCLSLSYAGVCQGDNRRLSRHPDRRTILGDRAAHREAGIHAVRTLPGRESRHALQHAAGLARELPALTTRPCVGRTPVGSACTVRGPRRARLRAGGLEMTEELFGKKIVGVCVDVAP